MKSKKETPQSKTKDNADQIVRPVPALRTNVRRTLKLTRKYWRSVGLFTLIYGLLYFVFVRVLTNVDVQELEDSIVLVFGGGNETFYTRVLTVGGIFGESANFDNQSGLVYAVISTVCSLAFIWLLRKMWAGHKPSVREAFYQGMYPLVPYVLVFAFILIQLIPFIVASFIFQVALNNGLAISFVERLVTTSILAGGIVVSSYFVIVSLIALYAVTMPGVAPSESRQTARRLLKGRRFAVIRQVFLFLVLSAVIALGPMLLIIAAAPGMAIVLAAIIIVVGLPWFHFYFYNLYRGLIDDKD